MSTRLCVERSISLNRNVTGPEGTGVTGALSTKGVSLPETLWGPKPYPRCDLLHIARSRALPVDRGRSRALRALRPPNPPRNQLRDCSPAFTQLTFSWRDTGPRSHRRHGDSGPDDGSSTTFCLDAVV